MRSLVFAFCVSSCAMLHAAPFTWDGGDATDNWSAGNNWNGNIAPATDGTASLIFAGGTATTANNNFTAGTTFAGIALTNTAAFTLTGEALTLNGPFSTAANTGTAFRDTVNLDIELAAGTAVTLGASHHVTINGVISGVGALTKINSGGELTLNGLNTYTGPTTTAGGRVFFNTIANIEEPCSFGAPTTREAAVIRVEGSLEYTGSSDAATDRDFFFVNDQQFSVNGSGNLTINGAIGGPRGPLFRGGRDVTINGLVTNAWTFGRTDGGRIFLNNNANAFTGDLTISDGWIIVPSITNSGIICAIGTGSKINFGQDAYDTTGRLRYTGTADTTCNRPLHIRSFGFTHGGRIEVTDPNATVTFSGPVTTAYGNKAPANPATDTAAPLWLGGAGNGILAANLPVGVRVIKDESGTWTLTGANTHTGATTVTTGTLILNGSTAAASAVNVSANGTLAGTGTVHGVLNVTGGTLAPGNAGEPGTLTAASAAFNGGNIILNLQDPLDGPSGKIAVTGHADFTSLPAITLNLPDGGLPAGTYTLLSYASRSGAVTLDRIYDNITITVGSTEAFLTVFAPGTVTDLTWSGSPASREWDTVTANWAPAGAIFNDSFNVTFDDTGDASSPVSIPAPVAPSIVTVATAEKHYTFSATGSHGLSGSASLIKSGSAPLTLTGNHSHAGTTSIGGGTFTLTDGTFAASPISIATNAHLNQSADSVIAGAGVSLTIQGTADLRGANIYDGETFVGALGISNRNTTVHHPLALGSTNAGTTVIGGHGSLHNSLLLANGVTVTNETLTIAGNGRASLAFNSAGSATWDGDIIAGSGASYINCHQRGSTFYIGAPGTAATISGGNQMQFREDGTIVLNSRINLPGQQIVRDNSGTLVINSTNNAFGRLRISEGTIRLGADNALPASVILDMGKSDANTGNKAYFDLDGHHQTITNIVEAHHDPYPIETAGRQWITSALPATLTADIPAGATVNFIKRGSEIRGAVTLVKDGPGTLTLGQTNLTSGAFIVSNGVLRLSTGSTGPDCTTVTVAAGTLALENPDALMPAANVTFPAGSDGTIDIAENVNVTVSTLWFGESQKRAGTWGSATSSAQHKDPRFTGDGTLTVKHDAGGTLLMLQ